ncbi:MAG: hypothetical protein JWN86_1726 [Planctomycetota bacterium]|nr:hypothetical protein [Planctomycetota bacterium]
MLPGPVFIGELRTTARCARHYVARTILGFVLLVVIGCVYRLVAIESDAADGTLMGEALQRFASMCYVGIIVTQGIAVVAFTPAIVAGTVAGERARRTLHDLLASDLTSAEIVLGKLAGRLLDVFVLMSVGLPILSMLTLLGGVDPGEVATIFLAIVAVALFLGGLSIFASTLARGPREAVIASYVITGLWLALPPLLEGPIRADWPRLYAAVEPVEHYLAMTNPFAAAGRPANALRMAGLLAIAGIILALAAVVALRPVARFQESRGPRQRQRWRWRHRPDCGEDPMAWKERHILPQRGILGAVVRVAVVLLAIGLAVALWEPAVAAVRETYESGYGETKYGLACQFNEMLRIVGTIYYVLIMVCVSASSAGSITSEREAETWLSLVASPLEGREILRAKRAGVRKRARPLVALLISLWLLGLVSGAIHPLGFLVAVGASLVYFRFAVALGTFVSLISSTTGRAIAATVAVLLFVNGGYLLCCLPIASGSATLLGCTPFLLAVAPLSYDDARAFFEFFPTFSMYREGGILLWAGLASLLCYGIGAFGLNAWADVEFDRAVSRPTRSGPASPRISVANQD